MKKSNQNSVLKMIRVTAVGPTVLAIFLSYSFCELLIEEMVLVNFMFIEGILFILCSQYFYA